jgi:myo-inositol-1(or 4)-monophosphatase
MKRFGGPAEGVDVKSSSTDMVSEADREAERAITELLRAERPDDGLLGEEGAGVEGTSGRRWVVDPLDGTTNYLYGNPAWCVSVAVEDADGSSAGVVYDATRDEAFRAARGSGADLNGASLRVNDESELGRALVATGFGYESSIRAGQAELLRGVLPRVRDIRRGGAAALDLAWVAAGRLDGYFERGLNPWDQAAGGLLVREAGGVVTGLGGEPPTNRMVIAGAPAMVAELDGVLRSLGA